jgi:hypothetical protein
VSPSFPSRQIGECGLEAVQAIVKMGTGSSGGDRSAVNRDVSHVCKPECKCSRRLKTPEHRAHMAAARRGKRHSFETRMLIGEGVRVAHLLAKLRAEREATTG